MPSKIASSRRLLTPVAPRDQQGSLRLGVEADEPRRAPRCPVIPCEPLAGEDQGDLDARGGELLELRTRLRGRSHADHAVVPRVPIVQLAFDVAQHARVVVDGEQDGLAHGRTLGHMLRVTAELRPRLRLLPQVRTRRGAGARG